jgi:hypothetical protein
MTSDYLASKLLYTREATTGLLRNADDFHCHGTTGHDDFLKGKWRLNFWKTTLLMENLLVLPEFLKNKYFVKGKSPKNVWIFEE